MTHYQLVANNRRRSYLVMIGFVLFVSSAVYVMAAGLGYGLDTVGLAFIFSGLISFASYWWSDKIILGISGAKPASREEFFDFYTITENLAMSQRLPMPQIYVIPDTAPNAFATGRDQNHAVVCATSGLLQKLDRSELEGVIAHELSHIQNQDMLLMSVVAILVGLVSLLADWFLRLGYLGQRSRDREASQFQAILTIAGLLLALLSPLIATLIKLAISRRREFLADAGAINITKNPSGLINALVKLDQDREPLEAANKATAHLYITNPLKNRHDSIGWFANLFQTHPPIPARIQALEQLTS